MAEYIEREALRAFPIRENHCDREHANEHFICGIESVMEYAEGLPAADVAPVVHGRWVHDGRRFKSGVDWCHCSECGKSDNFCARTNFCPNCGAKMDGNADG